MSPASTRPRLPRSGTAWFLAGYAGLAGFFALEAAARERGQASSLAAAEDDQGTTRMIVTAFAAATVLPPLLRRARSSRLPSAAAPAGLVMQVGGLALRAWSMRTLGRFYSRTLHTDDEHRLVEDGPYRLLRHPGYTGSLLTWTGFALTSRSLPVAMVVSGLMGPAYQRRIAAEETLLRRDLADYASYSTRTHRLIPFIW